MKKSFLIILVLILITAIVLGSFKTNENFEEAIGTTPKKIIPTTQQLVTVVLNNPISFPRKNQILKNMNITHETNVSILPTEQKINIKKILGYIDITRNYDAEKLNRSTMPPTMTPTMPSTYPPTTSIKKPPTTQQTVTAVLNNPISFPKKNQMLKDMNITHETNVSILPVEQKKYIMNILGYNMDIRRNYDAEKLMIKNQNTTTMPPIMG